MTETTLQELAEVDNESQDVNQEAVTDGIAQHVEQNEFVELDSVAQKKVNKLTWEKNEAKREADKLKLRIEELERSKPQEQIATVQKPSEELFYDDQDKYNSQLAEHIRAEERSKAQREANERFNSEQQTAHQQKAQADAQAKAGTFSQNATKLGLNAESIAEAANIVVAYGPSVDLANYLLDDPQGPQIVDYLAKNQSELQELVQLNPYAAFERLSQLKVRAAKKTVSGAPDPIQQIGGKGVPKSEHPALQGVTWD